MATTERSEPAWVAHEINAILLKLADKLALQTGALKSTLKKLAGEWPERAPEPGCPQSAYLAYCASQAALAALLYPAVDGALKKAEDSDPRLVLVRAICGDAPRGNDWSSLEGDLWASLERADLPPGAADEIAAKLEVLGSERVLADPAGGALIALRPQGQAPWPVYQLDATSFRRQADDLVEWLGAAVDRLG